MNEAGTIPAVLVVEYGSPTFRISIVRRLMGELEKREIQAEVLARESYVGAIEVVDTRKVITISTSLEIPYDERSKDISPAVGSLEHKFYEEDEARGIGLVKRIQPLRLPTIIFTHHPPELIRTMLKDFPKDRIIKKSTLAENTNAWIAAMLEAITCGMCKV
ncbi:MAG: hypothetical protein JWN37_540 [Candidatus Nomurabacteria bacterium]|nr:hypothetical protein [Candidatus Nomurabacteria bacterium]